MKYKYKNLKHVTLHGIEPYGEKIFDHKIEGGGIELVESYEDKPNKKQTEEIDNVETQVSQKFRNKKNDSSKKIELGDD